jgi:hypothetical protein
MLAGRPFTERVFIRAMWRSAERDRRREVSKGTAGARPACSRRSWEWQHCCETARLEVRPDVLTDGWPVEEEHVGPARENAPNPSPHSLRGGERSAAGQCRTRHGPTGNPWGRVVHVVLRCLAHLDLTTGGEPDGDPLAAPFTHRPEPAVPCPPCQEGVLRPAACQDPRRSKACPGNSPQGPPRTAPPARSAAALRRLLDLDAAASDRCAQTGILRVAPLVVVDLGARVPVTLPDLHAELIRRTIHRG